MASSSSKTPLILGILCLVVGFVGLTFYSKSEPKNTYSSPIKSAPQPTQRPTQEPTPTPGPMTVIQTAAGEWDVSIPEVGKWFDTKIPVITGQQISISSRDIIGGRFQNPNIQARFGSHTFYNTPGNYLSLETGEFCEPNFPPDMRDTIELRIEPGFIAQALKVSVHHYTASDCGMHPLGRPDDFQIHAEARSWWNRTAAALGRQ